ncbi:MAG: nuclear transport factor 2 family protein [Chloroflexota bacterium]
MKANATTEAAVLAVLNKFMETYQKRDIEGLMSTLAPDDDLFLFGTGIDEKRIGRAEFKFQAERDWAQTEALAFNFTWRRISAAGPVAWVAAEGLGQGKVGGQEIEFPLRMTAVLEQRGNEWLLVQAHVALPAPGQEAGDSVPV